MGQAGSECHTCGLVNFCTPGVEMATAPSAPEETEALEAESIFSGCCSCSQDVAWITPACPPPCAPPASRSCTPLLGFPWLLATTLSGYMAYGPS